MANNSNGRTAGVANPSALKDGQGARDGKRNLYKNLAAPTKKVPSVPMVSKQAASASSLGRGTVEAFKQAVGNFTDPLYQGIYLGDDWNLSGKLFDFSKECDDFWAMFRLA